MKITKEQINGITGMLKYMGVTNFNFFNLGGLTYALFTDKELNEKESAVIQSYFGVVNVRIIFYGTCFRSESPQETVINTPSVLSPIFKEKILRALEECFSFDDAYGPEYIQTYFEELITPIFKKENIRQETEWKKE